MKRFLAGVLAGLWLLAIPATVFASIGVGVGTGIIDVSDKLRAGGIYNLPAVVVYNTGTETATYSMSLTLNETQEQLKPNPAWFSFSPIEFQLEPGRSQTVTPTLSLPVRIEPGSYYGYLEAHPVETTEQGTTRVGVAAATILRFDVEASNLFWAILYRIRSLYRQAEPWSHVAVGVVVLTIVLLVINKWVINFKAAWLAGRQNRHRKKEKN